MSTSEPREDPDIFEISFIPVLNNNSPNFTGTDHYNSPVSRPANICSTLARYELP